MQSGSEDILMQPLAAKPIPATIDGKDNISSMDAGIVRTTDVQIVSSIRSPSQVAVQGYRHS